MNCNKIASVIALILLTATAATALAQRGYFAPTGEFQAFEIPTGQLSTIFSYSPGYNISLPTNNFTILYNPQSQNATVSHNTLLGSFSYVNTTAVGFQEDTNVNATKYPYFEISVTTSPDFTTTSGFAFGLRFLSRLADGSVALLWNDVLPTVEHVPSGGTTTLKAYVPNYNSNAIDIIGIRFYAEERAGIDSDYGIRINSIITSSLNTVSSCSSLPCYVPVVLPNSSGYFDMLIADTAFTGPSNYNIAFFYQNQMFISGSYSNGSSHVSLTANSQNSTLKNMLLASTPLHQAAVYVISTSVPESIQIKDLKLTFTPVPSAVDQSSVPRQTELVLLFATLMLVFGLPAELLILRPRWKLTLTAGIIMRLAIMPWTGHRLDTLLYIREAYLYYHQGWGPILYNPPTIFALGVPIGFMQFYYLMGLDRMDTIFLFHYGGVLGTLFVKLPFLLADLASTVIISKISLNKTYAMYYFLNPFSIFVSAVWGQYEGLTALALIAGYAAIARLRPGLAALASLGAFLIGGLVELFGFVVVPLLAVYLAVRRLYAQLALAVSTILLVLLIPSSVSQFIFSFSGSNPLLRPDIYSLSGNFGISSQLPLVVALGASAGAGLYFLSRTAVLFSTLAPVSAAIISLELFAHNLPQLMLIPLGLMTLLFAVRNDVDGLILIWFCGAILAFISIADAESFAYLLTGEGYYMIPLIEGGQHLKFYALSLAVVNIALLARAYRKVPFVITSSIITVAVGLVWFLVNFV